MYKKILLLLVSFFILNSSLNAWDFKLNDFQRAYLEKHNKKLLDVYQSSKGEHRKEFAIFLLTSSDVPTSAQNDYVKSMDRLKKYNIKRGIYLKGLNKETFFFIKKSIEGFSKNDSSNNNSFGVDPDIFEKLQLKTVPVLLFSLCKSGDYYPSDCKTLFLAHGLSNSEFFLDKIREKDNLYKILFK